MNAPPSSSNPDFVPSATGTGDEHNRFFNLSRDLLCIAGLDGYFKQVNPSWTRVLGWSRSELLARPVVEFIHPEDREKTLQARANLAKGEPLRELENRYRCKDGSYRWLSWQSSIEPGAATVFGVARDITERRLIDHERLIISKLESTGILAGGIAHDFNNLLASLMLNLEMIGLTGGMTPQQGKHLRQAQESARAASAITRQLLTFASGGDTVRTTTDLRQLLGQSMDVALSGSTLRGDHQLAPDLWPADVDEDQISQVIRNLVLNAREAMPAGGTVRLQAENLVVDASLGLELPPGNYLLISVTDQGTGIPPDLRPRIFDPYFSTKQRGTQKGMGLGLTISRSIIQKHGGIITVDSHPGRGTTVRCYLPAARMPEPAATPAVRPAPPHSARILVMDDEESMREIMAQTLTQIGYTVELAKDGNEAVALYDRASTEGHPFAAVVLDLTVKGGMGGAETIKVLRERDPAVRAVLMTGYNKEKTFRDYVQHGFQAALSKPFPMEKLRDILADVLASPCVRP